MSSIFLPEDNIVFRTLLITNIDQYARTGISYIAVRICVPETEIYTSKSTSPPSGYLIRPNIHVHRVYLKRGGGERDS